MDAVGFFLFGEFSSVGLEYPADSGRVTGSNPVTPTKPYFSQ